MAAIWQNMFRFEHILRPSRLPRIFHELLWRDHEDGLAPGQPQGVESEAYLNGSRRVRHPRTPGSTSISVVAVGHS